MVPSSVDISCNAGDRNDRETQRGGKRSGGGCESPSMAKHLLWRRLAWPRAEALNDVEPHSSSVDVELIAPSTIMSFHSSGVDQL